MKPEARLPILLVEDDTALARLVTDELEAEGHTVIACETLFAAREWLSEHHPGLIVTDLRLPDGHGMALVRDVAGGDSRRCGVIVITAFGSVRQAVEALQAGADDFLTKPLDLDHFMICVERVLEAWRMRDELDRYRQLSQDQGYHGMHGRSAAMRALFEQIAVIARAQGPVLIHGESGTGKELVARALHEESDRATGPFLAVNCAGVPHELMESEFFGHAAGAFTGARKTRRGLLQEANGGTLLLDEIGEMPLALQAKLLRALQDGSMRPVGQDTEEQVDVRIVAATHRDLRQLVDEGVFREDLYYRLETFSLKVPPLRERDDDIEVLAQKFLHRLAVAQGKPIQGFAPDALDLLRRYPYPGNVRELQNVVERAVAFCGGDTVRSEHLPARLVEPGKTGPSSAPVLPAAINVLLEGPLLPTLDELQKRYVRLVLDQAGGNRRRAAALLGIGRRTLYRWIDDEKSAADD